MAYPESLDLAREAGLLDAVFRARAVDDGHPYTTRSLISDWRRMTPAMRRNAVGRARRYLTAPEAQRYDELLGRLIGCRGEAERDAYGIAAAFGG